jgi:hypothetical protein
MSEKFYAIKEEKALPFSDVNAIFSAMYTPHTPTSSGQNDPIKHYQKGEDNFSVTNNENGALLEGKISPTLINRLKGFGVALNIVD